MSADSKQPCILDLIIEFSRRTLSDVHLSIRQLSVAELCYKIDILIKLSGPDGEQEGLAHNLHNSFSEAGRGRTCVHMEAIFGYARVK